MKVTEARVVGTTGANKQPAYGEVAFSDGKSYTFIWSPLDSCWVFIIDYRTSCGTSQRTRFKSTKRAEALSAYFA